MTISNKKMLITGGASGIGLAMAERFLKDGNTIIICGRRTSALEAARARFPSLNTRQCDLSVKGERESLYAWIADKHPDLQVLINNAGIQQWMSLDDKDYDARAAEEMAINIDAPVHLTSLFLNLKSLDTIMNVTSGLAFSPLAKVPVYCATKAFLHSYTLSLRYLLRPRNISVIEIIPPALNTDLGGKGIHDHAPPVSEYIEAMFTQLEEGKQELTFGFSDAMIHAGPEELQKAFNRMNPVEN